MLEASLPPGSMAPVATECRPIGWAASRAVFGSTAAAVPVLIWMAFTITWDHGDCQTRLLPRIMSEVYVGAYVPTVPPKAT